MMPFDLKNSTEIRHGNRRIEQVYLGDDRIYNKRVLIFPEPPTTLYATRLTYAVFFAAGEENVYRGSGAPETFTSEHAVMQPNGLLLDDTGIVITDSTSYTDGLLGITIENNYDYMPNNSRLTIIPRVGNYGDTSVVLYKDSSGRLYVEANGRSRRVPNTDYIHMTMYYENEYYNGKYYPASVSSLNGVMVGSTSFGNYSPKRWVGLTVQNALLYDLKFYTGVTTTSTPWTSNELGISRLKFIKTNQL